ncbi:hypothetical protein ACFQFC_12195 [Amorphoplanes digitatis]|uniref:Uncharacterized protein n=1 Tax=Actinoplanes digitatis TaxID=1868 RepID=A0A7W7MSP0_9ACTN|nr:hypothetical protein [Actinoplanes digitatis]MBB4764962.1 hypothetical protein [Actinoplanes digitatis]BFE74617.1 hypothetical protein GCM10020092_079180 [Actinoplanes digitatis]
MRLAAAVGVGALVLAGVRRQGRRDAEGCRNPVVSKPADNGIAALPAAKDIIDLSGKKA